jgi:predicted dinucleotide-binding enzyme
MKIAIIGAGNIGVLLSKAFAAGGHDVRLANSRDPATIRETAESHGVTAMWAADAVENVDVVVTSVPPTALAAVGDLLSGVPEDVPVIDTGNYHPYRDGRIEALEEGQVEAVWTAQQLGRPIAKAWNAVMQWTLEEQGAPAGTPGRLALPVAGAPVARELAASLTDLTGFDAVDVGGLEETWRMQPGTAAYCTELPAAALRDALARADREHAPRRRDLCWEIFRTFGEAADRQNGLRVHRAITLTPDPA